MTESLKKALGPCLAAVLLALPVLAGCATPPAQQNFPELTYRHLAPINLAVSSFEVEDRYIPPLKAPNVEHRSPVPPYAAARQWGQDRIKARGGDGVARLVILDASIREVPLPTKGGLTGAFTTEQAARYDGQISVRLDILGPRGEQRGFVTANAQRSQTVPEGTSLAERERVWFTMTEEMMKDLNAELEQNIARHLHPYMIRA